MMPCFECDNLLYDGFTFCCNFRSCEYWNPYLSCFYPEDFDCLEDRFCDDDFIYNIPDSDDDFINKSIAESERYSDYYDDYMIS